MSETASNKKFCKKFVAKNINKIFAVTFKIMLSYVVANLQLSYKVLPGLIATSDMDRKYRQHPNEIVTNNSRVKSMPTGS